MKKKKALVIRVHSKVDVECILNLAKAHGYVKFNNGISIDSTEYVWVGVHNPTIQWNNSIVLATHDQHEHFGNIVFFDTKKNSYSDISEYFTNPDKFLEDEYYARVGPVSLHVDGSVKIGRKKLTKEEADNLEKAFKSRKHSYE